MQGLGFKAKELMPQRITVHLLLFPLVLLILLGCTVTPQPQQSATPIPTSVSTCPPGAQVIVRETVIVQATVVVTQTVLVVLVLPTATTTPTPIATSTPLPTPTTEPTQSPPEPTQDQPAPTQEPVSTAEPTPAPSGPSADVASYLVIARTQNGMFFNILNSRSDFAYYEPLVREYVFNYYAWAVASKPTLLQIRSAVDSSAPPAGMGDIKTSQQTACSHLEIALERALKHDTNYQQEIDQAYTFAMQAEDALNQYPK